MENQIEAYKLFELGKEAYEKENYESALEFFTKAAETGNNQAIKMLGIMYRDGIGVEQNVKKAIEYFSKTEAWDYIYEMYRDGIGVEQDTKKAAKYLIKYCIKAEDWRSVGMSYLEDLKNGEKAIEYFTKYPK